MPLRIGQKLGVGILSRALNFSPVCLDWNKLSGRRQVQVGERTSCVALFRSSGIVNKRVPWPAQGPAQRGGWKAPKWQRRAHHVPRSKAKGSRVASRAPTRRQVSGIWLQRSTVYIYIKHIEERTFLLFTGQANVRSKERERKFLGVHCTVKWNCTMRNMSLLQWLSFALSQEGEREREGAPRRRAASAAEMLFGLYVRAAFSIPRIQCAGAWNVRSWYLRRLAFVSAAFTFGFACSECYRHNVRPLCTDSAERNLIFKKECHCHTNKERDHIFE